MPLRLLNWNVEWKRPAGPKGRLVCERIASVDPDVAVLTETNGSYLDGGHTIHSEPDYGLGEKAEKRKVTLWSREPWTDVDAVGHPDLTPGRFVSGRTTTPVGEVTVLGVCIPWHEAGVRWGRADRERWEEHAIYLDALKTLLAAGSARPFVLAGDFNQRIPRKWQPKRMFAQLEETLADHVKLVTGGEIDELGEQVIDHVALSAGLRSERVWGFHRDHPQHGRMSDHHGVVVEIRTD